LLKNKISANHNQATALIQRRLAGTKHPLAQLNTRLQAASPSTLLRQRRELVTNLSNGLPHQIDTIMRGQKQRIHHLTTLLETLGPTSTLKRGYAIITDKTGSVVRSTNQTTLGERLDITLDDGQVGATVDEINLR
jgi:exodeoxyribonuclease VII large subunit